MRRFLGDVKKKLRPLSMDGKAAFVNFPDRDFPAKFHEMAYYGSNKDKLRDVKDRWDPDGFFSWNQGVRRSVDPEEDDEAEDEDHTDKLASEQWDANGWTYFRAKDLGEHLDYVEGELGTDDEDHKDH